MTDVERGDLVRPPGRTEFVQVRNAMPPEADGSRFIYLDGADRPEELFLSAEDAARLEVLKADGRGRADVVLAGLWAHWLRHSSGRLHPSVMTAVPLRPYAHQSEAVYARMMPQPRLRFLLADEPGTGKTIMAGLWLRESQRLGMIDRALVVCPAHLVSKWIADVKRFLGAEMKRVTPTTADQDQLSWDQHDLWVVSMDLAASNRRVRQAIRPDVAGWEAVVIDEAHRLTPTAKTYYRLGEMLTSATPQALLLTATPHRGKEWLFRALMHLVDPEVFPNLESEGDEQPDAALRPTRLHFLRRMKEQLVGFDGEPLFRSRTAHNAATPLSAIERHCYDTAMKLVDEFFPTRSAGLAKMVYGKRASSSLHALRETLLRRMQRTASADPDDAAHAADPYGEHTEDDTADEASVEAAPSTNPPRERISATALADEIAHLIGNAGPECDRRHDTGRQTGQQRFRPPDETPDSDYQASKWPRLIEDCFEANGITPGSGEQAVVFTEYADTAEWLVSELRGAGFSAEAYSGRRPHPERDNTRTSFARREFEILVSTDAGGEGIDLQTACVLVNWDIPWSLVRLEQRMGRIHRIGQTREVHLYNMIATGTREGDAMARLLDNLVAAANELDGKMFDSLRLVTQIALSEAGVGSLKELLKACVAGDSYKESAIEKLTTERLRQIYEQQSAVGRTLSSAVSTPAAEQARNEDLHTRVNPEVVERFADICRNAGLITFSKSAAADRGCYKIGPRDMQLPQSWSQALHEDGTCLVTTTKNLGTATASAEKALTLGPAEPAAGDLFDAAADHAAPDMHRGAVLWDPSAQHSYTLCAYETELTEGRRRSYRHCFMVRINPDGERIADWGSLADLTSDVNQASFEAHQPHHRESRDRGGACRPEPNSPRSRDADPNQSQDADPSQARLDHSHISAADAYAERHTAEIAWKRSQELSDKTSRAEAQLRLLSSTLTRNIPDRSTRIETREQIERATSRRRSELAEATRVGHTPPRRLGWAEVRCPTTGDDDTRTDDTDSERIAIEHVTALLRSEGFSVTDVQHDGCGYDLHAARGDETRLVEVKGAAGSASAAGVRLTGHEMLRAALHGDSYWLYVVDQCSDGGVLFAAIQNPFRRLTSHAYDVPVVQVPGSALTEASDAAASTTTPEAR